MAQPGHLGPARFQHVRLHVGDDDARPGLGERLRGAQPDAAPAAKPSPNAENEIASPDGKLAAYIKDYNLWVRDTKTNQTTQLTTDGAKDYGYATDNAGWTTSDKPVTAWQYIFPIYCF
jgi:hypothetical protein